MDNFDVPQNAEGVCPKCGHDLGITGQCTICAINSEEFERTLHKVFTCRICGQRKTHYRLYGYRCSNPTHAEMERELELAEIRKWGL